MLLTLQDMVPGRTIVGIIAGIDYSTVENEIMGVVEVRGHDGRDEPAFTACCGLGSNRRGCLCKYGS